MRALYKKVRRPYVGVLLSFIILMCVVIVSCAVSNSNTASEDYEWDMTVENNTGMSLDLHQKDGKHRGMSVFNWRNYTDEDINQLVKNNIEWVALVPFYFQETARTKTMRSPVQPGDFTRRDSTFIRVIHDLHKRQIHVHLKPHLWMHDGWRSNIELDTEEEWDIWFESYRQNILHHAIMAEACQVELFCVGAEFRSSMENQPDRWETLIDEIKDIYTGKLTYAANWDGEYKIVPFWDKMDYIGIQAYFPLTSNSHPNLKEIKSGWKPHLAMLEELSVRHSKPILFTEIGYRSDSTATIKPWEWSAHRDDAQIKKSTSTQNLAYEALFQSLWGKKWFAGVYFWQWHNDSEEGDKYEEMNFSPRFKPAENTMARWFGKK